MAIVPVDADPWRILADDLCDHTRARRVRDPLRLDNDSISDLRSHLEPPLLVGCLHCEANERRLAPPGRQAPDKRPLLEARRWKERGRADRSDRRPDILARSLFARLTARVSFRQLGLRLGTVVRRPALRRVEVAWGGWIAVEWAHFVALGVFAYRHGGTTGVGIAGVIRLLPAAVIAPFASGLADRHRRERFLAVVVCAAALALIVSAIAAAEGDRGVVLAAAAVMGIASTLFRPALQALLPSLAESPHELLAANGVTSSFESVGTLVGPLLASGLMSVSGVAAVFAAGALVLAGSIGMLARVSVEGRPFRLVGTTSIAGGAAVLRQIAGAPVLVGLMVGQTFVRGCLNVLLVAAAFEVLHGTSADVGYLTAAIGVGGLAGAAAGSGLAANRLVGVFALSLLFWGLPIGPLAVAQPLATAALLVAVIGAANSIEDIAGFTLLQRVVPNYALAAALGVFWGLAMAGTAIGSAAVTGLIPLVGTRTSFIAVGAILPALVLVSRRHMRAIEASIVPDRHLEVVEGVPMFAPLSLATKEQLAGALIELKINRGDTIVRRGDAGDLFYIVAQGELVAEVGETGAERRVDGFFGEIALLRDIPRTATVRALTQARLFALRRDDFLAALSGHRLATAEAYTVTDAYLADDSVTSPAAPHSETGTTWHE
jgi:cyclic nucleotide-binding protein/MFS transporter